MDSSFLLSSSQLSIESFGDEGLLLSCSSRSSAGDLPDCLDLPDYFDLSDYDLNDTEEPEEHSQCVEQELLVCENPEDSSRLTTLNYRDAFGSSGLTTVPPTSSPCQAEPLHMSVRGMSRDRHQFCYEDVMVSSATFQKPNDQSDKDAYKNSLHINNKDSTKTAPRKGSVTDWQGERSQVGKRPADLYAAVKYDNLSIPIVVHPNREEATNELRVSTQHSSERYLASTTTGSNSAGTLDEHTAQIPLPLSKTPGTLLGNQKCRKVQPWTVPELHENVKMMSITTNTERNAVGDRDKSGWALSWQQDSNQLLCPDRAVHRPKPASFRESKVTTEAQGDSLRQLQPGEMHVDLLPTRLRYLAAQEGNDAAEASRCCAKEKKMGFKSQIQNSCPAPHTPAAQSHPTSSAHLVEEDASTDTQMQQTRILETQAVIKTPLEHDILLGRGHRLNKHPGNVRFRSFVQQHQDEYLSTPVFEMKTSMTHMLVELCKEPFTYKGSLVKPRFLRFHRELNGWNEVSDDVARRKVSHLLRKKLSPPKTRRLVVANFL